MSRSFAFKRTSRPDPATLALCSLIVLGAAQAAPAHDFWIEPSDYRPAQASSVQLDLRVGEDFAGRAVSRRHDRIERFLVSGPEGEREAAGVEGRSPAGFARIDRPATYVAVYQSRPSSLVLPAERFERYLAHKGLDAVIEERRRRGETAVDGREIYSRCAKTLISASTADAGFRSLGGCPLEIVPLAHPGGLSVGESVPFRVLYRGGPLAGVRVVAISKAAPGKPIASRTDQEGTVALTLPGSGPWLVKAVHMVRASETATGADWESFWASLTFKIGFDDPKATPAP